VSQLCGLERRTARSGKDSIDHGPGSHDDLANAVAGAADLIVLATRAMNTGCGVAVYGTVVEEEKSERRRRIEAEMAALVKPDDADHAAKPCGPEQRVDEIREAFRAGGDREQCLADLMEIRQNCGDPAVHRIAITLAKEIRNG
jgi:hypothetical protein